MTISSVIYTDIDQEGVKVTYDTGDILHVPVDTGNRHYQEVQEWVDDGNTITAWAYADSLPEAKTQKINEVKQEAGSILSGTDWMVIRASEGGTSVPSNIATWRATIRTESNDTETAINNLTTVNDVMDYTVSWTEQP